MVEAEAESRKGICIASFHLRVSAQPVARQEQAEQAFVRPLVTRTFRATRNETQPQEAEARRAEEGAEQRQVSAAVQGRADRLDVQDLVDTGELHKRSPLVLSRMGALQRQNQH